MHWNINGSIEMIKSPEISSWFCKNFNICFLLETHMTKGEDFNIDYFKCCNNPFSDVLAKKARGGVTCLIKLEYMQHVTKVNCDNPDNIIISLHGRHTIFGSYIPPSDSIYYSDLSFTIIPNIFFNNENAHVIIWGGDLNSRVGNITQTLPMLRAHYRPNVDASVNAHGKLLRRICSS